MPVTLSTVVPALHVSMPSDTAIPGLARRQIWASPEVTSHSLVVMTLPRLYLAAHAELPTSETIRAIEKTLDVEAVLGPLATSIDLAQIERVRLDLIHNKVRIDHAANDGGNLQAELVFAKPETADTVFSKLWRRLGADFTLRPYRPETWELVRTPLLIMMALSLGTAFTSFSLNGLADILGGTDWVTAGVLPGWRAICVVGGAAVAAAHVWLYRRLSQPPERLELIRT